LTATAATAATARTSATITPATTTCYYKILYSSWRITSTTGCKSHTTGYAHPVTNRNSHLDPAYNYLDHA
jgi:hypothetical protein